METLTAPLSVGPQFLYTSSLSGQIIMSVEHIFLGIYYIQYFIFSLFSYCGGRLQHVLKDKFLYIFGYVLQLVESI